VRARDRILKRPEPDLNRVEGGSRLVDDSYLVGFLKVSDQLACLEKLLAVAADRREIASTRRDALTGARNLVIDKPAEVRQSALAASKPFVRGEQDGSHLDEMTGKPHPLSSFKINLGSSSLRGVGLRLAGAAAHLPNDMKWVRDQAIGLLHSPEVHDVHAAALTLGQLSHEVVNEVDANLLSGHDHFGVRQLSALMCMRDPDRYQDAVVRLAADPDPSVRFTLAEAARQNSAGNSVSASILDVLARDVRADVRRAATTPLT
jgi:hypothetical protein